METLVLLSKKSDSHISVNIEFGEGDPIRITLKELKRGEMSDKCVDLYIKALFSLADRLRLL